MRDPDIRRALIAYLEDLHRAEPDTLVVEEVCVRRGSSRVDVATVGEEFHGYEIKSRKDRLHRLPGQIEDYQTVFDKITVVSGLNHLGEVLSLVPSWCGVITATWVEGSVRLERFRSCSANFGRDTYSLAQFLWRDEALDILRRHGLLVGVKSKPRTALWQRLASSLPIDVLSAEVRSALRKRSPRWRRDARRLRL